MTWKKLSKLEDIPMNGMKQFDVDGVAVLVVRSEENYLAIPPLCPHMEEPLINGICDGARLTCTAHLWQFDMATGEPLGVAERGLLLYETQEEGGEIHINIEEELLYEYQKEN